MRNDGSNPIKLFTQLAELLRNKPNFRGGDHQDHADSQIKRPSVIFVGHVAKLSEKFEDRLGRPSGGIDFNAEAARQNAGNVIRETTAGYMGSSFEQFGFEEGLDRLEVGAMNLEEFVGEAALELRNLRFRLVAADLKKSLRASE